MTEQKAIKAIKVSKDKFEAVPCEEREDNFNVLDHIVTKKLRLESSSSIFALWNGYGVLGTKSVCFASTLPRFLVVLVYANVKWGA